MNLLDQDFILKDGNRVPLSKVLDSDQYICFHVLSYALKGHEVAQLANHVKSYIGTTQSNAEDIKALRATFYEAILDWFREIMPGAVQHYTTPQTTVTGMELAKALQAVGERVAANRDAGLYLSHLPVATTQDVIGAVCQVEKELQPETRLEHIIYMQLVYYTMLRRFKEKGW